MAFQHKEGRGALFRNEKREEHTNQPNAKGNALIGGVLYEIAAWTQDGPKGKFQSLSFKPAQASRTEKPDADDSEEIPF